MGIGGTEKTHFRHTATDFACKLMKFINRSEQLR